MLGQKQDRCTVVHVQMTLSCSKCTDLEELLAGGPKSEITIFGGFSMAPKANQESLGLTRANKGKESDTIEMERN